MRCERPSKIDPGACLWSRAASLWGHGSRGQCSGRDSSGGRRWTHASIDRLGFLSEDGPGVEQQIIARVVAKNERLLETIVLSATCEGHSGCSGPSRCRCLRLGVAMARRIAAVGVMGVRSGVAVFVMEQDWFAGRRCLLRACIGRLASQLASCCRGCGRGMTNRRV